MSNLHPVIERFATDSFDIEDLVELGDVAASDFGANIRLVDPISQKTSYPSLEALFPADNPGDAQRVFIHGHMDENQLAEAESILDKAEQRYLPVIANTYKFSIRQMPIFTKPLQSYRLSEYSLQNLSNGLLLPALRKLMVAGSVVPSVSTFNSLGYYEELNQTSHDGTHNEFVTGLVFVPPYEMDQTDEQHFIRQAEENAVGYGPGLQAFLSKNLLRKMDA